MNTYSGMMINPGDAHNYNIAGNISRSFALGEIGSEDDFFLIGCEPPADDSYPLLTGNFLNSEGDLLFRLVKNVLTLNPGQCSKILGDHVGYEIHDSAGEKIFAVRTVWYPLPAHPDAKLVTTISGTFYNKARMPVFRANFGEDERIEAASNLKHAFGVTPGGGGFQMNFLPHSLEQQALVIAMGTGGSVYQPVTGRFQDDTIEMSGKAFINAELTKCRLTIASPYFLLLGETRIIDCTLVVAKELTPFMTVIQMASQAQSGSATRQNRR